MSMITFVLLNFTSFAQQQNLSLTELNNKITNIPYVFKGEVVDIQYYLGDENGNKLPEGTFYLSNGELGIGFSSAKVKICQILKGENELSFGTIEIITSSPYHFQPYLTENEKGETIVGWLKGNFCSGCEQPPFIESKFSGIFFCEKAEYNGKSGFNFDNSIGVYPSKINLIGLNSDWIGYKMTETEYNNYYDSEKKKEMLNQESLTYAFWYGNRYHNPSEIYMVLSQFDGINIYETDNCSKIFLPENKNTKENNIQNEQNQKNYRENMEQMIKLHNIDTTKTYEEWRKEKLLNHINKGTKGIDLSFEIANPKLTGTSSSDAFMEFDILVSSNSSVYYSGCLIRLSYNTSAFGTNVAANNTITVTRGNSFNTSTYTNPDVDKADWSASVVGIPFNDDFSQTTFNRTLLSSTPEVLMHIKMKISNSGCDINANIEFADITFTPMFSYYTLTPNAAITEGINFDNTTYSTGILDKTCMPIISSFTNDVPAGNGSILTISGKYFGVSKGTGTVIFKDANQGNVYPVTSAGSFIGIDNYDTLSWTDNEIIIKLPAVLDQIATNSNNPTPGSGLFKVKNFTGKEKESSSSLLIPYALYQGVDPFPIYQKANIYLANQNDSGGYTIRCNSSMISSYPNAKSVINRAIKDWNCATLVNWRLGSDTTSALSNDGVCSIFTSSTSAGLMSTYHRIVPCTTSTPKKYYLKEFDIAINSTYNWQVDTSGAMQSGKYDFFHAIAHELGHGLLLFHANQLGEIMYYGANIGPYPENQRVLVWNSLGAMDGGFYVTDNFSSSLPACTSEHDIFSAPQNCTGFSVQDRNLDDISLLCFPNPIESGNLNIRIGLVKKTYVYYKMYNSMGQLIKTSLPESYNSQVTLAIPTDDLKEGFYFMQVYLNNRFKTVKWIKM